MPQPLVVPGDGGTGFGFVEPGTAGEFLPAEHLRTARQRKEELRRSELLTHEGPMAVPLPDEVEMRLAAGRHPAQAAFPPDGKDHWPGWEDSAVPPDRIGTYVRELRKIMDRHGITGATYGHFGQGCIHCRLSFDLRTADGLATYRAFMEEAADLRVGMGGSVSGEHGEGQQRGEVLEKQYGLGFVRAMREFKAIWAPQGMMSPGKVVDVYRMDENLKLGTDYNPPRHPVKFAYEEDGGDFAHAILRCVGIGKCRVPQVETTMCPSFQVTHEEKHTTRGRARLLYEMLKGATSSPTAGSPTR